MKRRILITGATKGIGRSIAEELSSSHRVFIAGRDEKKLEELCKQIKAHGFFSGDLLLDDNYKKLFEKASSSLGGVDVMINNAGEYIWSPVEKTSNDDIERLLKLNLEIPYKLSALAAKEMKAQRWGRIINIGSISGAVGEANASLYSASKAGLIGMTKALGLELAEYGITVNTINPGWVKTDLTEQALSDNLNEQEELDCIPQHRFIKPEEIAKLTAYLISDDAKGITGQSLNLCAGLSLG